MRNGFALGVVIGWLALPVFAQTPAWPGVGPWSAPVVDSLGAIYNVPASACPDIGPVTIAAQQAEQHAQAAQAGVTAVSAEVALLRAQVAASGVSQAVLDRLSVLEADPLPQNGTLALAKGQTLVLIPPSSDPAVRHISSSIALAQSTGVGRVRLVVGGGSDCAAGRAERSGYMPVTGLSAPTLPSTVAKAGQSICLQADSDLAVTYSTSFVERR